MPRQPTWEDWLRDPRICQRSMRYFQSPRVSLIKILPERIAEENVLGHLKKAYHNLDLANSARARLEDNILARTEIFDNAAFTLILCRKHAIVVGVHLAGLTTFCAKAVCFCQR